MDSKCFIGYSNSYSTNKDYKQDKISINIGAGKEDAKKEDVGILNFKFSKSLQPKLDLSNLIALLDYNVKLVDSYYATIISNEFREKTEKEEQDYWIGWINYFSDKEVANLLPKNVEKKVLPNGGVIFWLSKEKALSTKEDAVQKTIEIRDILGAKGILNYY